jgi:hypothetical protein
MRCISDGVTLLTGCSLKWLMTKLRQPLGIGSESLINGRDCLGLLSGGSDSGSDWCSSDGCSCVTSSTMTELIVLSTSEVPMARSEPVPSVGRWRHTSCRHSSRYSIGGRRQANKKGASGVSITIRAQTRDRGACHCSRGDSPQLTAAENAA